MTGRRSVVVLRALAGGLMVLALGGCMVGTETIGEGESARTWSYSKLSRTYAVDYERVWSAAAEAIHDLKLKVAVEQHDALVGRIEARRADDLAVGVELENLGPNQAKVVVKVGFFATERDKRCATVVMDAIDKRLGR
jgi:hypothetical protein